MPAILGNAIALLFVGALVGFAVFRIIKNRRRGGGSCSCGCADCPSSCPSRVREDK